MTGKVKAKVKFSSFEYERVWEEPVFEPLRVIGAINPVYRALRPWNVAPADVKYRTGGTLSTTEPVVTFELAKKHYTVSLGLASFGFKANFVAWDQAPVIIEVINTVASTLEQALKVKGTDQILTILMQLAPEGRTIGQVTNHLASPLRVPAGDIDFYGFLLYTKSGSTIVVDKSAADPNDLFVKIVRKYKGGENMEEMSKILYKDEQDFAEALAIEIE